MTYQPIIKNKITKINIAANQKLKQIYQDKGITRCELNFENCCKTWALGFAHHQKRWKYIKFPERLSEFDETLLACTSCHMKIEGDKILTEKMFKKLRPNATNH